MFFPCVIKDFCLGGHDASGMKCGVGKAALHHEQTFHYKRAALITIATYVVCTRTISDERPDQPTKVNDCDPSAKVVISPKK
jgi:hypothetical protein